MKEYSKFRRICLVIGIIGFLGLQPFSVLANQRSSNIERLFGISRFQTMLQIALKFPRTVDNVVLATGNTFPDALAGVPLAHQKQGPLLLVDSSPELSQDAFDYIKEHLNKEGNIYILGGTVAVPDSFITALQNLGFKSENIHRIAGYDRYETALAVAKELQHDGSEFYLVQGDNFPDALSASVLAATTGYVTAQESNYLKTIGQTVPASLGGVPLILLPSKGPVPESIINYLNSMPDDTNSLKQRFYVVGGPAVIPEGSLSQLKSQVKRIAPDSPVRISGGNRYSTMEKINSLESSFDSSWQNDGSGIPIPHIYLASGENFPDALAGAVLAAQEQAPLVLVNNSLPQETVDLLMKYWNRNQKGSAGGTKVTVLGGASIIADKTVAAVSYILNYGQSITNQPLVQIFAGSGNFGYLDGQNQMAEFAMPSGITQGKDGTVYIADTQNHRIRAVSKGQVTTVAGVTTGKDDYGMPIGGFQDGSATAAMFNQPKGLAVNDEGTIYVADSGNGAIRVINHGFVKTLVKGLNSPSDLVIGREGELYVTETLNHRILRVDKNGNWSVLAGGGYELKDNWLIGGYADGTGGKAQFNEPCGLALGPNGELYVADTGNQRIRMVSLQGVVTTLAGSGTTKIVNTDYIKGGFLDGPGTEARFNFPSGIAVSGNGTVYVADTYNHRLREISASGVVKTLAGDGEHGKQNGFPEQVQFDGPWAIKVNADGNLLISDQLNNSVRLLQWRP